MSIERLSSNTTMNYNIDTIRKSKDTTNNREELPKEFTNMENEEVENRSAAALNKDQVEEIVEKMNNFLEPTHTSIKFELHDKLHEYYVTIIDQKTDEVIREIPSKKILDIYAAMTEFLGLIVDKKI